MVVGHDQGGRVCEKSDLEDVTRRDDAGGQSADVGGVDADQPVLGRQHGHGEVFAVASVEVAAEQACRIGRRSVVDRFDGALAHEADREDRRKP